MNNHFYNPRNVLAAHWASAAEQTCKMLHPELSVAEIRNLPMMQGVYTQLRTITEEGKLLPKPGVQAKEVDNAAYLSQQYLVLATTAGAFTYTDEALYDAYLAWADAYNDANEIADFSTEDLAGFALCLIVWLGTVLSLNQAEQKILDWVFEKLANHFGLSQTVIDEVKAYLDEIIGADIPFAYRPSTSYPSYGVLGWEIPNNAQVIMLGDWGTGMDDAKEFLKALWKQAYLDNPSSQIVFIHLGDIYYCGLPVECNEYFLEIFQSVSAELASELPSTPGYNPSYPFQTRPPIFTIPGNHEYYSNGGGYFQLLDALNSDWNNNDSSKHQQCSFFCLRSADGRWQFLGMDTGQDDHNALSDMLRGGAEEYGIQNYVDAYLEWRQNSSLPNWMQKWIYAFPDAIVQTYFDIVGPHAPKLQASEVSWLQNKFTNFSGATILCSHHQLFSQEATIDYETPQYLNVGLRQNFASYFGNNVAAWFWGHEHTYAMYKDGLQGLNKGRLLGSSAYEATDAADTPYANNYPMIQFNSNMFDAGVTIGANGSGILNHAAAIFTFNGSDVANVVYYQFPAWSQLDPVPSNPALTVITSEQINRNSSSFVSLEPSWLGNQQIKKGTVHTANSPSVAAFLNNLFLVYQDHSGHLNWCYSDVADFKPVASDPSSQQMTWTTNQLISISGNTFATNNSPASLFVNNIWYIFYVDTSQRICLITAEIGEDGDLSWSNVGALYTGSKNLLTTSGFAVTMYEGGIYIYYLDNDKNSDNSYDIKCAKYNPLSTGTGVTLIDRINSNGGDTFTGVQLAAAGYNTDQGGSGNFLMLVYLESDGDLKWVTTQNPDSASAYTSPIKVNTHKEGGSTDSLQSSAGVALTIMRGNFMMVRVDNSQNLKSQVYDISSGTWYGDVAVDVHANNPDKQPENAQSSHYPSLAVVQGGAFLLYRGDSTDDIYWAYA